MEVPRLGAELELQLPATATATQDLSCICNLHHSSQQCQIPNPLSEAGMELCAHLMYYYYYFLVFLGPLPQHMEVPRLGVESEL